jgi:hypothetical protein
MKNIKKTILYSIFIIVVQLNNNCYSSWFNWPKPAFQAATETAVTGANQLIKDNLPKAGEIATEASAKIGVEAANKFAPAATLFASAYAVSQVYSMGRDIAEGMSSRYWPSAAQRTHALKVDKEYEILSTEKAFKSCLVYNAKSARDTSGLPSACQRTAQAYGMAAGHKPLKSITKTFNTVYGEPKHDSVDISSTI